MAQDLPSWLVELVLGSAVAGLAWFNKTLHSKVEALEEKQGTLIGRVNNVQTIADNKELAVKNWVQEHFVEKGDFDKAIEKLEVQLDKHFGRLETKIDRLSPPPGRPGTEVGKNW